VSEHEEEEQGEEAAPMQETPELRYFRSILGATSRPKPELPTYEGSLNAEHLIDWISELDKYFEYDEIEENKKVRLAVTRLKGHASLWWNSVHAERRRKNKPLIKSWDRMVAKMRAKFLPKDYQQSLYRQMQNLKQILLTLREYTEEFYKVNLRAGYVEGSSEKAARYINGLRMEIQDEINMMFPRTMEEAYQCALRAEEKLLRKKNFNRGRGSAKGRGKTTGREKFAAQKGESSNSNQQEQQNRGNGSRGGRPCHGGRGRGRGK
jgi:hypothetical protein